MSEYEFKNKNRELTGRILKITLLTIIFAMIIIFASGVIALPDKILSYDFDYNDSLRDDGVYSYTPTVSGATLQTDGTYYFDGNNDKIQLTTGNLDLGGISHTIITKLRIPNTCTLGDNIHTQGWFSRLYTNNDCNVVAVLSDGSDVTLNNEGNYANGFSDAGWYHVVIMYDDTTNRALLYVNGILTDNESMSSSASNSNPFEIGGGGFGGYWEGYIDKITIYNGTLTEEEIILDLNTVQETRENYTVVASAEERTGNTGINTHMNFISATTVYDENSLAGTADTSWHQEKFEEANLQVIRGDSYEEDIVTNDGILNLGHYRVERIKETIEYCYNNGNPLCEVNIVSAYTPTSWSENTTDCISNPTRCSPINGTEYAENITVPYIKNITNNGEYLPIVKVEIWNEPGLNIFYLPEATNRETNTTIVEKFYDDIYEPRYTALKNEFGSNITIVMGGHSDLTNQSSKFFAYTIVPLMVADGTEPDRHQFHIYWNEGNKDPYSSYIKPNYDTLREILTNNSISTDIPIDLGEFNIFDINYEEEKNILLNGILGYAINKWTGEHPEEDIIIYQWSDTRDYGEGIGIFPEHPLNFNMLNDPHQGGELKYGYNATKEVTQNMSGNVSLYEVTTTQTNNATYVNFYQDNNGKYYVAITNLQAATNINLTLPNYLQPDRYIAPNGSTTTSNLLPVGTYAGITYELEYDEIVVPDTAGIYFTAQETLSNVTISNYKIVFNTATASSTTGNTTDHNQTTTNNPQPINSHRYYGATINVAGQDNYKITKIKLDADGDVGARIIVYKNNTYLKSITTCYINYDVTTDTDEIDLTACGQEILIEPGNNYSLGMYRSNTGLTITEQNVTNINQQDNNITITDGAILSEHSITTQTNVFSIIGFDYDVYPILNETNELQNNTGIPAGTYNITWTKDGWFPRNETITYTTGSELYNITNLSKHIINYQAQHSTTGEWLQTFNITLLNEIDGYNLSLYTTNGNITIPVTSGTWNATGYEVEGMLVRDIETNTTDKNYPVTHNETITIQPYQLDLTFSEITNVTITWTASGGTANTTYLNITGINISQATMPMGKIIIVYGEGQVYSYTNDLETNIQENLYVFTPTLQKPIYLTGNGAGLYGRVSLYTTYNNTWWNVFQDYTTEAGYTQAELEGGKAYMYVGQADGFGSVTDQTYVGLADTRTMYIDLVLTNTYNNDIIYSMCGTEATIEDETCTIMWINGIEDGDDEKEIEFQYTDGVTTVTETYEETVVASTTINLSTIVDDITVTVTIDEGTENEVEVTLMIKIVDEAEVQIGIDKEGDFYEEIKSSTSLSIFLVIIIMITAMIIGGFAEKKITGAGLPISIIILTLVGGYFFPIFYVLGGIYFIYFAATKYSGVMS